MIEFRKVSKSFWNGKFRTTILSNASFTVPQGEGLGILAPNGSGKTTIVNMMAGLERPDAGEIVRDARVSFPVGMKPGIMPTLSGAENVRYIAGVYGVDPDYAEAFCLDFSGIEDHFFLPVRTYSSGMKSRLGVSLLLALNFDVYLIDEALSTGDGEFGKKAAFFLYQKMHNATVVMVSHNIKQLQEFCKRPAVLKDGQLHILDNYEDAKALYDYDA